MSDLVSSSRVPAGVPECFGGRLSKRLSVSGGKPSQLVEPVPGRDGGDRRRPFTGIVEGAPDALQSRGEHAPRRAHPAHAVEGIAQAAFAETDDPTKGVKRCGSIRVRADVGFGALDSRAPRGDRPLAPLPNRMIRLHAWQGTSAPTTSELADLPDRAGKTNREAAIFYQIQDDWGTAAVANLTQRAAGASSAGVTSGCSPDAGRRIAWGGSAGPRTRTVVPRPGSLTMCTSAPTR